MLDAIGEANAAALVGLLGGLALGFAARIGRFCTLGAIEDFLYPSDQRRLRMWGVAVGTAIILTQAAIFIGWFDPAGVAYLDRVWNPIATIVGGLMFGYGMALSGNCAYGALARFGGGDLRSLLIVLVMGLSAYIVMSGPLASLRVWLFPVEANANNAQGIVALFDEKSEFFGQVVALSVGSFILLVSILNRPMLQSPKFIVWGGIVGLSIVSGWVGTFWISMAGFESEPVETHSFAAPIGGTLIYAMTASGNALSFSVGSVVGVVVGACLGSLWKNQFRWEACDDPRELRRQILGAILMGPGAILAVGCSVGQGISAFSVLSFSAPVTLIAIFIGAKFGLRQLIEGL